MAKKQIIDLANAPARIAELTTTMDNMIDVRTSMNKELRKLRSEKRKLEKALAQETKKEPAVEEVASVVQENEMVASVVQENEVAPALEKNEPVIEEVAIAPCNITTRYTRLNIPYFFPPEEPPQLLMDQDTYLINFYKDNLIHDGTHYALPQDLTEYGITTHYDNFGQTGLEFDDLDEALENFNYSDDPDASYHYSSCSVMGRVAIEDHTVFRVPKTVKKAMPVVFRMILKEEISEEGKVLNFEVVATSLFEIYAKTRKGDPQRFYSLQEAKAWGTQMGTYKMYINGVNCKKWYLTDAEKEEIQKEREQKLKEQQEKQARREKEWKERQERLEAMTEAEKAEQARRRAQQLQEIAERKAKMEADYQERRARFIARRGWDQ